MKIYKLLTTIIPAKPASMLQRRCLDVTKYGDERSKPPGDIGKPPLLAKKIGQRYEVTIAGYTLSLQERLYKYLQKLFNADHPDGWMDKNHLDSGFNQVKYIYRLLFV